MQMLQINKMYLNVLPKLCDIAWNGSETIVSLEWERKHIIAGEAKLKTRITPHKMKHRILDLQQLSWNT